MQLTAKQMSYSGHARFACIHLRKGLVRMTLFSALTCSIPSKEGMNTVSAIYEPERINKYINQSSQPEADPVKNMVYTCTPNNFLQKKLYSLGKYIYKL